MIEDHAAHDSHGAEHQVLCDGLSVCLDLSLGAAASPRCGVEALETKRSDGYPAKTEGARCSRYFETCGTIRSCELHLSIRDRGDTIGAQKATGDHARGANHHAYDPLAASNHFASGNAAEAAEI